MYSMLIGTCFINIHQHLVTPVRELFKPLLPKKFRPLSSYSLQLLSVNTKFKVRNLFARYLLFLKNSAHCSLRNINIILFCNKINHLEPETEGFLLNKG